jgi:histidinol-phosphate aminotransferase
LIAERKMHKGLKQLAAGFKNLNLDYIPSKANFLLVKVGNGQEIFQKLQKLGIITRPMPNGLKEYLRISVGTNRENEHVLYGLRETLSRTRLKV